ncbi:hypothetical protein GOP47_0001384 [Adiantum capillus-veneris]|uniref:t-SNARE coiled-coil homology domain-containing protein n=1 Tax=Adiantum capillus-veneris TaxID=13818 RepID=A0A9D4ZQ11_ADICA|nr:hypothetical protein GOP47_0001384 [Adiantum capillus-veneris]
MAPSSYRDRTTEFLAIADRARKTQSAVSSSSSLANGSNEPSSSTRLLPPRSTVSLHSEFNKRASKIGLSIHQTSQKLSKLAKLAKRTSMFDDPAVEIQELTAVIKEDITALNAAISDLQTLCSSHNETSNQSKQSSDHSMTVVDNLKSRLMNTTKEFKEVLTLRTENLKVHENRRQLFSANTSKEKNPFVRQRPLAFGNKSEASTSATPWANGAASPLPLSNPRRGRNEENVATSSSFAMQQQQQQMVPLQDSYMQSRAEALQNVESTIMELGSIFTQLATMVAQQGEIALRIDENMDETLGNVEGAQGALLKYLNRISSNRWLILKIFFVLIVFLLIFVVFVA